MRRTSARHSAFIGKRPSTGWPARDLSGDPRVLVLLRERGVGHLLGAAPGGMTMHARRRRRRSRRRAARWCRRRRSSRRRPTARAGGRARRGARPPNARRDADRGDGVGVAHAAVGHDARGAPRAARGGRGCRRACPTPVSPRASITMHLARSPTASNSALLRVVAAAVRARRGPRGWARSAACARCRRAGCRVGCSAARRWRRCSGRACAAATTGWRARRRRPARRSSSSRTGGAAPESASAGPRLRPLLGRRPWAAS